MPSQSLASMLLYGHLQTATLARDQDAPLMDPHLT